MALGPIIRTGGVLRAWGRSGIVVVDDDDFVSGLTATGEDRYPSLGLPAVRSTWPTRPTATNTGNLPGVTLAPYTGPSAGGLLVITSPITYTNIDFGSTRIQVRAPNVRFVNCRWRFAANTATSVSAAAIDYRRAENTGGGRLIRCDIENLSQIPSGISGVMGWNVTIDRCRVLGFVDNCNFYVPGSPGSTDLGVRIYDSYFGPMAFYWAPSGNIVHPTDPWTHNDAFQYQGGHSSFLVNVHVDAHISHTVGTGTPNSGSEFASHSYYTQLGGEAKRDEYLYGSSNQYAPGTIYELQGIGVGGLMVTPASGKGQVHPVNWNYLWGSGGSAWLNAGSSSVSTSPSNFGTLNGLRVKNNQRNGANWAVSIKTGLTVTMTDAMYVDAAWNPTTAITRRNA